MITTNCLFTGVAYAAGNLHVEDCLVPKPTTAYTSVADGFQGICAPAREGVCTPHPYQPTWVERNAMTPAGCLVGVVAMTVNFAGVFSLLKGFSLVIDRHPTWNPDLIGYFGFSLMVFVTTHLLVKELAGSAERYECHRPPSRWDKEVDHTDIEL